MVDLARRQNTLIKIQSRPLIKRHKLINLVVHTNIATCSMLENDRQLLNTPTGFASFEWIHFSVIRIQIVSNVICSYSKLFRLLIQISVYIITILKINKPRLQPHILAKNALSTLAHSARGNGNSAEFVVRIGRCLRGILPNKLTWLGPAWP